MIRVFHDFLTRLAVLVKKEKLWLKVYFHNLSRFDGILIFKFLVKHKNYAVKPLIRDGRVFQYKVYEGKKLLFVFRDSMLLLPSSLMELASNMCPELGTKGYMPHKDITVDMLSSMGN